jgi:hypothetical protein
MSEGIVQETSKYALEGTAAHQLAEWCLLNNKRPEVYPDTVIWVELEEIKITSDMMDAVNAYVDVIYRDRRDLGSNVSLLIEHNFSLDWVKQGMYGTNDAALIDPKFEYLMVYDFKYGAGVPVEVKNNPQLKYYALGALGKDNPQNIKYVDIVVVQPRAPHPDGPERRQQLTVTELYNWAAEVLRPGAEKTESANPPRYPGEWCRWCPALHLCPEIQQQACEQAQQTFSQVPDNPKRDITFPDPHALSDDQIRRLLDFSDIFEAWLKGVREYAKKRAEQNQPIPGYKLVKTRTTRSWADLEVATARLIHRLKGGAYEQQLLSPAKAEKALKAAGFEREKIRTVIDDIVHEKTGRALVPESDKRPAIAPEAQETFGRQQEIENADFLQ